MLHRGGWHIGVLGGDEVRNHFRLPGDLVDAPDQLGAGGVLAAVDAADEGRVGLLQR